MNMKYALQLRSARDGCLDFLTSKNVLTEIDATGSLTDASPSYMEDSVKHIWMTIMEPNPVDKELKLVRPKNKNKKNLILLRAIST